MNTIKTPSGFLRFKKKFRRAAFIKALILGLSCGAWAAAGVVIWQKRMTFMPDPLLYLPVGVGVALLITLVAYFILRPSDRRLALKLDTDLDLGEKVQTMLAYRDGEGDMLTLQREDANRRLEEAPARAVRYRHPWVHALAPVLACALLTLAVVTPIKAVEPPTEEPEPPFELSSWQETALTELIEQVKSSNMETAPKASVVKELEVLLAALRVTDTEADMKVMVITVISNLNRILREHNSANLFSPYLAASEHTEVAALAMSMDMLSGLELEEALTQTRESLRVDEVAAPLEAYVTALTDVLSAVGEAGVSEDDPLLSALSDTAASLSELQDQLADYTKDWAQASLDTAFEAAADKISDALFVQYTNRDVKNTAVTRLMEIFGISEDELPAEEQLQLPSTDDDENDDDRNEEDKGTSGGIGNQEVLYGSDDQIFDPIKNEYVKYGDVINEYFAAVSEKIIDGQIPDTLEQFISDYFATLYDGSEKETAAS